MGNIVRVESLTVFRFIAAIFVVTFHFGGVAGLGGIFKTGHQMVTFFFVLSGFVMVMAYYKKDNFEFNAFWFARIARIAPVYFLAMVLAIVFPIYKGVEGENISVVSILLHMSFLQAWIPPYPLSINSPAWSLSVEAFFYLVFPFILVFIRRINLSVKYLFLVSLAIWLVSQIVTFIIMNSPQYGEPPNIFSDIIYYFPLLHLCSFLLGVSAGVWFLNNSQFKSNKFSIIFFLAISSITFMALNNLEYIEKYLNPDMKLFHLDGSFYAPLFVVFIISLALLPEYMDKILSNRFFVLLGNSSYSLYILHGPIAIFFIQFILPNVSMPIAHLFYWYLFTTIIISILIYRFVEIPAKYLVLRILKGNNRKLHNTEENREREFV